MTRRSLLSALALAAALAAARPAVAGRSQEEELARRIAATADEAVAVLDMIEDGDRDAQRDLAGRLADLPEAERPAILLVARHVATDAEGTTRREVLEAALDHLGDAAVRELLRPASTDAASFADRALLFWFARERRIAGILPLVLDAARNMPPTEAHSPALAGVLRDALAAIVRREPRQLDVLANEFATLPEGVQVAVLAVADSLGGATGTRWTGRLLFPSGPHQTRVLARLLRLPVLGAAPLDGQAEHALLACLASDNADDRRLAAACIARFHVVDGADPLVGLLADADPAVAVAAHAALLTMTTARLPARESAWQEFLERERAWRDGPSEGVRAAARSADAREATRALRSLRRHRLLRASVWEDAAAATRHASPEVRALACETLGALGAPEALSALRDALSDARPEVVAAASAALARITWLREPASPAGWAQLLGSAR